MVSTPEISNPSESVELNKQPSLLTAVVQRLDRATFVVGDLTLFVFQILSWISSRKLRRGTFIKAAYQIGVLSLPVVGLTGMFIGMVLAVQSFFQFSQIGMESRMGVNPIHFLVVPRVFAALLLIPILTLMADFMGILGGFAYSHYILHIDAHQYFEFSSQYVTGFDLLTGIIKSLFFGACIAIVSCYFGFHSNRGAQGVGNAATAAFVTSFVMILAMDLIVGISLDKLYYYFNPAGASLF